MEAENQITPILLLPMPISPRQKLLLSIRLKKDLETKSLDELVEQELTKIYNWKNIKHPATKRQYQSQTLVYTREELRGKIRLMLQRSIGKK